MQYLSSKIDDVFAHELGHNLGLEHTHNGRCTSSDDNEDCGNCKQESVSRSRTQGFGCTTGFNRPKCEVNGDYLCDTPADPNLSGKVDNNSLFRGCQLNTVLGTDNWGDTWNPSLINIMAYTRSSCRSFFTYGQLGIMLNTIQSESDLDFISTTTGYSIAGPTDICTGNTYTYSVPSISSSYTWSVPPTWNIISGQGTRTVQVHAANWVNNPEIFVRPDCGYGSVSKSLTINTFSLNISGPPEMPADGTFRAFSTDSYATASNYSWTVPQGWGIASGQGTANVFLYADPGASAGYVRVSSQMCGTTINGQKYMNIGYGGGEVPAIVAKDDGSIEKKVNLFNDSNEKLINRDVAIFPNPTTDCISIKSKTEIQELRIYSASGSLQTIITEQFSDVDITNYQSGIYIIHIYFHDLETKIYRIIKK